MNILDNLLIKASRHNILPIVKRCLELGASANPSGYSESLVIYAASWNRIELFKLMLDHGSISSEDKGHALVQAAARGHVDIVRLLLRETINPTCKTIAIQEGIYNNREEVVKLLLRTLSTAELNIYRSWSSIKGYYNLFELLKKEYSFRSLYD